jgi:hypothetical protein
MSKKKKKYRPRRKASFNIGKSKDDKFITYDRMWAENGVLYIRGKDGIVSTMTTLEAAHRAQRLNAMLGKPSLPKSSRDSYVRFVEKVIDVLRQAKAQLESPGNTTAAVVSNVMAGKTAEGKEIKMTQERRLELLEFKFPMLTSEEVRTVCNERTLNMDEKTEMLRTINQDRMVDKVRQAEAANDVVSKLS